MATKKKTQVGTVNWFDLTVKDAGRVADFYAKVVGWKKAGFSMGDYEDFCMNQSGGQTVAGVCHARAENASIPPQWLIYIHVKSLSASLKKCRALGGKVLVKPRPAGDGKMAVIQDPAGAVAALYQA